MSENDPNEGNPLPIEKRVSPWLWILTVAVLASVLVVTALLAARLQSSSREVVDAPPAHADGG